MAQGLIRFRILAILALYGFVAVIKAQQPFNYDATKPPACCNKVCCCSVCDGKCSAEPPPGSMLQQLSPMNSNAKNDGLIIQGGDCTCETTSAFNCTIKGPGGDIVLPPGRPTDPPPSYPQYPVCPGGYQTGPGSYQTAPGGYQTGTYQGGPCIVIGNTGGGSYPIVPIGPDSGSYATGPGSGYQVQPWPYPNINISGQLGSYPVPGPVPAPGSYPSQPPAPGSYPIIDIGQGGKSGGPSAPVDIINPDQGWVPGGSQSFNVRTKTVWSKDCNCEISKKTFCKPITPCPPGGGKPSSGYPDIVIGPNSPTGPGSYPASPQTIPSYPGQPPCHQPPCTQPGYPVPQPPCHQPPCTQPVYPQIDISGYPVNPPSGEGYNPGPGPSTVTTPSPVTTTAEPDFWANSAAVILLGVAIFMLILVCILGALVLWFILSKKDKQPARNGNQQQARISSRRHSVDPVEHPVISNPQLVSSSQPVVRDYEVSVGTPGEYRQQRY